MFKRTSYPSWCPSQTKKTCVLSIENHLDEIKPKPIISVVVLLSNYVVSPDVLGTNFNMDLWYLCLLNELLIFYVIFALFFVWEYRGLSETANTVYIFFPFTFGVNLVNQCDRLTKRGSQYRRVIEKSLIKAIFTHICWDIKTKHWN